jgi:RHS repeat-associated protein
MFAPLSILKHQASSHVIMMQRYYCLMLLMVLAFPYQLLYAADTSGQITQAPTVSTDPNAPPSILETIGIPNSQTPNPTGSAACAGNTGSPSCGEQNVASQSNQSQTNQGAGNPINVITGNKYQRENDLPALPGLMGIEIVRHYNSLHMGLGQIGYGWRLSYETDLQVVRNQIYITQADGSRVIFNRSSINPSDCACQNPAQGHVMIYHTPKGDEYTWYWLDGKQLHFNQQGKLTRISAPTGESVSLTRGLKGELLKVTDPQGRSLIMHYADQHQPGFKGIVAIDTPVGRYTYHHDNDPKSAGISNLIRVEYPQSTTDNTKVVRHYHYGEPAYTSAEMVSTQRLPAIPKANHLLTGISLAWQADNTKQQQRLRTWAYDQYGRGVLSVHGLPKQLNPNGTTKAGAGIEQVSISYVVSPIQTQQARHSAKQSKHSTTPNPRISQNGQLGQTILTNSLGQTTTYSYTLIAGEPRLLQVVGAGCAECGETNRVYGYDKLGRLSHNTQVKVVNSNSTASKTPKLQGLHTTHTEYDLIGRPIRILSIAYLNGKAQPAQLTVRYGYANTPIYPQLNTAQRAVEEPINVASLPSLVAKPSVVAGKEHQWHITYNQHGQPTKVTELGYRPALIGQHAEPPTAINRTITYRYRTINNRSLLVEVDGPLPNGKGNSPKDSDITQYQYDPRGAYLTRITAPGNITTQLSYDLEGVRAETGGTGRIVKTIAHNGIATLFNYNQTGKVLSTQRYPKSLSLASAKESGLLQSTAMQYDIFGNTTMIKRADGQAVYMQYGVDGKLTQLNDALGNRVEWKDWTKGQYQQDEKVTTQQWFTADAPDAVARAWYFWRDNQNRLTQRLSPDGGLDTWDYSNADVTAAPQNHWVQHIDPLNRMTLSAVSNQAYAQVRMTPDGYMDAHFSAMADQAPVQTASKQSNSQPVQIQDDFGRVIQFSSPQHGTHIADYNAANRITNIQQADGTQIDYTYDVAGRLLTKTATHPQPKQTASVHYAYNLFGLSQIKDSNQTLSYSQDLLGREIDKATTLTLKNGLTKTYHIHTRYTVDGKVKAKQLINGDWLVFTLNDTTGVTQAMTLHKTIWPSLTNQLADWLNMPDLPLQIATTEKVVTDIKVHPFNGITHIIHGNGISDDYGFDIAGRLITVSHGTAAYNSHQHQPFVNATYKYDADRRLISEQINTGDLQVKVKEYAYTGWNTFTTPPQSGFTKAVVSTTPTHSKDAGIANARLSQAVMADTTLDQAGRATTDQHYRYQYNVWGKLTAVQTKTNQQTIATYQYNALGERIMASYPTATHNQQANTNQTRYYVYDKKKRIAELDEAGNVIQQYLYVNQTPVALINTPIASSDTNQEGVIAIHTDRRHAPMMATDEQGKVIWQAEYDAWGKVIPETLREERGNQNTLKINLRLPGQWQDQATGLYYNYQRDYNPDTGRYLTPDPLGFPDGADPYAYVNNDPLNKLDPLGLYQIDVHYYMTYFLGVMAGLTEHQALVVASAAQYIDDNPYTQPLPHSLSQAAIDIALKNHEVINKLASYHFTQYGHDKANPNPNNTSFGSRDDNPQFVRDRVKSPNNPQLIRLLAAANTNYKGAPCKTIKEQLFGEYLHAFEDTFGHRDQLNAPISINGGFGHGSYLHEPDKTYNDTNQTPTSAFGYWYTRQARSLEMEKEVFAQIQKNFGVQGVSKTTNQKITIDNIIITLERFNKIHETEESTNDLFTGSEKLKVLNDFLTQNGFSKIPTYNVAQACEFRQDAIVDIAGNPPPGVILGTPLNCPTTRGE